MYTERTLLILGAGPAGLSAGIYAARAGAAPIIIERGAVGGQILLTSEIENYPGGSTLFPETGAELTERMREQAERFGARIVSDDIAAASVSGPEKVLFASGGTEYRAKALIIASGASPKRIGCAREEEFVGRGISYCAVCDGRFFEGLEVYVAGGGETAVEEAVYLAGIASNVHIVHRRDTLRASAAAENRAKALPNIDFIWNTVVEEVGGSDALSFIRLRNVLTGEHTEITARPEDGMMGLFGFVGMAPETGIFGECGLGLKDGYIEASEDTHTNLPGVFAAGDVRRKPLRQVVTAAADGAVAGHEAAKYLRELQGNYTPDI